MPAKQQAEAALREFEAVFWAASDGLWLADAEGMTLRVNAACERITGYSAAELEGRSAEELVKKGYFQHSVVAEVVRRRQTITRLNTTQSGKRVLVTGTPVFDEEQRLWRVVCSVRDITALVQLEYELEVQGQVARRQLKLAARRGRAGVIASSKPMRNVVDTALRVACSNMSVCLMGESGVGKEVVADLIHSHSERSGQPLIKVNCAAVPEALMESEFFGYEQGAFTGAQGQGKPGYFELAHRGTLLLDEVGDLPLPMQAKFLRVLQDLQVRRIGSCEGRAVDVRIIAATNHDLRDLVDRKLFREDLYYRLNGVSITIPSLRQRRDDIADLVRHYLRLFGRKYGVQRTLDDQALATLMAYSWPGNVRELCNVLERLVVMGQRTSITQEDLPAEIRGQTSGAASGAPREVGGAADSANLLQDAVQSCEAQMIQAALRRYGSLRQAAKALGTSHVTVLRKARRYGLCCGPK